MQLKLSFLFATAKAGFYQPRSGMVMRRVERGGEVGTFMFWSFPRMVNLSIWHGHGMGWNLVIIFLGSLALGLTFSGLSKFPEFPKFLECSKFLEFSVS